MFATNFGTSTTLRTDASPDLHSYLRFDVQGLSGNVTSATLRIYANSASSAGYTVYRVDDNTWTETGITLRQGFDKLNLPAQDSAYDTAPPVGPKLGSSGAITAGICPSGSLRGCFVLARRRSLRSWHCTITMQCQ